MSRRCELSGTGVQFGNNVSHSQRKTRRRFEPNMRKVRFFSELVAQEFRFNVNVACMRSVEKAGGIDQFMIKACDDKLSTKAKVAKRKIMAKSNLALDSNTVAQL